MSSTERAPEPTMEEILASIRRIISEDEAGTEQQPQQSATASGDDDDHLELVEGEADDKIINDIARVLSGGAPAPVQEPAEESAAEDILDLTAELGGLEPVETLELVEEFELEEIVLEEPLELEPEPEPVAAPVELELPAEPEPEPEPVLQAAPPPEPAPVSFEPPQRKLSASEEAASALERAIAALRAGQVPTSAPPSPSYMSTPQPAPQPAPLPPTPALFGVEPQPAPGFIPSPAPEVEAAPEPEIEPEPELVLSEFEIETTETLIVEFSPSEEELSAEPEATASEPDYMAPLTNGSGPHEDMSALPEGSKAAIEESIKDILRPMLRQWLDENMARVVTAALKDEIREHPARFQSD